MMAGKSTPSRQRTSRTDIRRLHLWQIQAVRDVLFAGAVLLIVCAGYALRAVTVPLLVALLLAYLFEPVIERMCRKRRPRGGAGMTRPGAVTILLLTVGGSVIIVLALVVPLLVGQAAQFISDVQDGTMRNRIARLERFIPEASHEDFQSFLNVMPGGVAPRVAVNEPSQDLTVPDQSEDSTTDQSSAQSTAENLTEQDVRSIVAEELGKRSGAQPADVGAADRNWVTIARSGADAVGRLIASVIRFGLLVFLIPFYFFFFCLWYPDVVKFARTLIPQKNRDRTLELVEKMDLVVAGFVRGRIVISIVIGAMLAVGWLICGVPYALALGMVIGIFSVVPYLGGVGVPLAVGLLLFDQLSVPVEERTILLGFWGVVFWPTLVYAIVQVIETYVLTPMIQGKATNLDPVTIVVAVLAGGSLLGVYGMLLAIPLAACGKILFTDVLLPRIRAWTEGKAADPLPISRD